MVAPNEEKGLRLSRTSESIGGEPGVQHVWENSTESPDLGCGMVPTGGFTVNLVIPHSRGHACHCVSLDTEGVPPFLIRPRVREMG